MDDVKAEKGFLRWLAVLARWGTQKVERKPICSYPGMLVLERGQEWMATPPHQRYAYVVLQDAENGEIRTKTMRVRLRDFNSGQVVLEIPKNFHDPDPNFYVLREVNPLGGPMDYDRGHPCIERWWPEQMPHDLTFRGPKHPLQAPLIDYAIFVDGRDGQGPSHSAALYGYPRMRPICFEEYEHWMAASLPKGCSIVGVPEKWKRPQDERASEFPDIAAH